MKAYLDTFRLPRHPNLDVSKVGIRCLNQKSEAAVQRHPAYATSGPEAVENRLAGSLGRQAAAGP